MPNLNTSPLVSILANHPLCNPVCRVCHYKGFDYERQIQLKERWAELQLNPWKNVLKKIRPAPDEERSAYRSKSWMRASFQEGAVSFGMFRSVKLLGRWEKEFISWDTCPIHLSSIQQMIRKLRESFPRQHFDVFRESLMGVWIGSPHLVVVSRSASLQSFVTALDWDQILVPPFDRVWFHCNPQVGRKIFGNRPIEIIAGSSGDSGRAVHPIRAFRQSAQTLLIEARKLAVQALLKGGPAQVLDLYCGTGDLSLLLPPEIGWIGIELAQDAVLYANSLRPLERSLHSAYAGAVEHRLADPSVLKKISESYALYLNPPRSGLTQEACSKGVALIRQKAPTSIVYLSCSASSLARDLVVFEKEGYQVKSLQPFDFFPQTEHFETLAILSPRTSVSSGV